jgi:hypothetical protein
LMGIPASSAMISIFSRAEPGAAGQERETPPVVGLGEEVLLAPQQVLSEERPQGGLLLVFVLQMARSWVSPFLPSVFVCEEHT